VVDLGQHAVPLFSSAAAPVAAAAPEPRCAFLL